MKCSDIMLYLEQLSPKKYALDWDNVGLLVGTRCKKDHAGFGCFHGSDRTGSD